MVDQINKKIVLMVGSDSFLLKVYSEKLSKIDCDVKVANAINQGLAKTKEFKPNLILLDLEDNLNFLQELKKVSVLNSIPVIILSNDSDRDSVQRCLKAGATEYFIKTHVLPTEIVDKIKSFINN